MTTTWEYQNKESGTGYEYEFSVIEYDEDSDSGQEIYYDSIGLSTTWTLQEQS